MKKHYLLHGLAGLHVLFIALAWAALGGTGGFWALALSVVYLALSLVTFVLWGIDKRRAILGRWRIRERTLLGLMIAGGAFGGYAGMCLFHHKTRELVFLVTAYLTLALHTVAMAALLLYQA